MANSSDPSLSRVSLCLIVRNEANQLARCLCSVADLVRERIVVDTGSTDRTRAVAAELGARVLDFPWCDSFAAARNESIRHATGDWIFWLDADEYLDDVNRERLRALFAALPDARSDREKASTFLRVEFIWGFAIPYLEAARVGDKRLCCCLVAPSIRLRLRVSSYLQGKER